MYVCVFNNNVFAQIKGKCFFSLSQKVTTIKLIAMLNLKKNIMYSSFSPLNVSIYVYIETMKF